MHGYAALTCAGRICAAGYVNFCPMSIDEKPSKYSNMLATAIHEARAVHSVRAPWVVHEHPKYSRQHACGGAPRRLRGQVAPLGVQMMQQMMDVSCGMRPTRGVRHATDTCHAACNMQHATYLARFCRR